MAINVGLRLPVPLPLSPKSTLRRASCRYEPNEKHQLSQLIREIRTQFNLTVILIEHHVLGHGLVRSCCRFDFGQLLALGRPAEVRTNPAVIEAYLGAENESC